MLNINNLLHHKLTIFLTTVVSLFGVNSYNSINANPQTSSNDSEVLFYGNEIQVAKIGAEYILFEDKDDSRGLVYVQNSDVFSCFQGNFDRQSQSLNKITFAYPEMGTENWIENKSEENISLTDFPHKLNALEVNESAKQLFQECLNYFQNN